MSSSSSKNDPVMRQSQSPQSRSGNNSLSPNHHAARKDLPKKGKVVRFQCRHVGCSASFGNSRNREKHETFTCKIFLKSSLADTKSKLYPLPSHEETGSDPTHCRFPDCEKKFNHIRTIILSSFHCHKFIFHS